MPKTVHSRDIATIHIEYLSVVEIQGINVLF